MKPDTTVIEMAAIDAAIKTVMFTPFTQQKNKQAVQEDEVTLRQATLALFCATMAYFCDNPDQPMATSAEAAEAMSLSLTSTLQILYDLARNPTCSASVDRYPMEVRNEPEVYFLVVAAHLIKRSAAGNDAAVQAALHTADIALRNVLKPEPQHFA